MAMTVNRSDIVGWGADLDPKNRPAVPKEKRPVNGTGAHWEMIEPQIPRIKVLHSLERPGMTPLFGTSTPPTGLSGKLRDYAFQYSESHMAHWLTLMFADRVNVVEGILDDLAHGKIPNVFAEMGLKSEIKHRPEALVRKAAVAVGIFGLATAYYIARKTQKRMSS